MPPDDPNCIIVFFGIIRNHILYFMFFTPGDIEWTKHDLLLPIAEDVGVADTLNALVLMMGRFTCILSSENFSS